MSRLLPLSLTLLLSPLLVVGPACRDGGDTGAGVAPGCGDGVVDVDEACDDGDANSDSLPDACRSICVSPWCGDGVADSDEDCDDGNAWGGDGCTPACSFETGQLETEPNDDWQQAGAWKGGTVHGALPEGDVDCFSLTLPDCAAVGASLVEPCQGPATLRLHDPDGAEVAVGGPDADGCAHLDPAEAAGARFVESGDWSLCVEPLPGGSLPWYTLEIDLVAPEDASFPLDDGDDPDGDGRPDSCDDDRDGDGIDDVDDNCPDQPNGPDMAPLTPSDSGFIRTWLAAGPYTGTTSSLDCRPSDDQLVAEVDADATPVLGQAAGTLRWTALWSSGDRVGLLTGDVLVDYGAVEPPREVYLASWLYSPEARSATLALGPDDGARAWLGGVEVLDISGCQGTNVDQFQAAVELQAGWQLLMVKVRDQGGDWGLFARFLDDEGLPLTDLELALGPDGAWPSNQEDSDGDGLGDACDGDP